MAELRYNKATRNLSLKGLITFSDFTEMNISDSDIVRYSISQQIGSSGLPLGSTEAASYTLEIGNEDKQYKPQRFDGAKIKMQVGIEENGEFVYEDFGVWFVDDADAPEQGTTMTLSGYDALGSKFAKVYSDKKSFYPTTIASLAQTMCTAAQAGVRLKNTDFPNSSVWVENMPKWEKGTTIRDILSYCAICAGGFARIDRSGDIEIVSYVDGANYELDPNLYQRYTPTGGEFFKFNAIEALMKKNAKEYTRYAIAENISGNATNTIQIEYNPLLTKTIVQSIVNELAPLNISAGEIVWGGDPVIMCGDFITITDLRGETAKIMVTAQEIDFDGGMNAAEKCILPTTSTTNGESYSSGLSMYDANGNIKAERVGGLDESVVNATTAHFETLDATTITTDLLTAALIKAVNLTADVINAKTLIAKSITSDKIDAGAITADKIATGAVDALAVDALTATIGNLTAGDIEVEGSIGAALARFNVITAGTATFDQATIQHLVSNALNLKYGVGGDVFIENLRVVFGQMVQATIGDLCIKASDDKYYNIDVDSNGNVTATLVPDPTDGEISAGQTSGGRVILETHITAESLNTSNLLATYALINKIDAAKIDVSELFANTAFVGALTTNKIIGDKSITIMARDIAANEAAIAAQSTTLVKAVNDIAGIQSQIDGSITTWYYEGTPTASNEPAVNWTTEALKEAHQGDLYYDKLTNKSYRWLKKGSTWAWELVIDSEVSAALDAASKAKDTADSKKRIFVTQPVPPYDAGDLWVQGADGDIYVCTTPKLAEFAYAASDWKIASKYTDDTKANAAQNTANEAKTAAGNAQAAANAAQSAADNAQSDADTAGEVAQQAVNAIGDIPQRVEVMPDGTYFKDEDNASVLKITSGSVTIGTVTGECKGYSQFAANYVQFGKYQMRRTADGGMAFKITEVI